MWRLWRDSAKTRCRWSSISKTCRIKVAVTIACSSEGKSSVSSLARIFQKLLETGKKIKTNDRYKKIMTILTSPETVVQVCFLESLKPVFDQFLQIFQAEGPFIHVLHQAMLHLLKQVMFRFLKQNEIQGKTVSKLLKLDSKKVNSNWKMMK